jgi:preprotein translocase subunit YajC
MGAILILAVTFGLMYAFFILPQKKRVAAHRDLLKAVDVGDEVMLTSGLYGTVVEVDESDDVIWLEVAEGVELKVARGAIGKRTEGAQRADAAQADDEAADEEPDGPVEPIESESAGPVEPDPDPSDPR